MRVRCPDARSTTENRWCHTECRGHRDLEVAIRSSRWMLVVALAAATTISRESSVEACSLQGPGIFARSVWPGGADQHPPTNTRLVVSYQLVTDVAGFEFPAVGPDVALLDGDGTAVAISFETVGSQVVIRPVVPLLPDHTYQLADRRTVPCNQLQNECSLTSEPRAFASFTTGASADTTPPVFAGLAPIVTAPRMTCDNGACCGPYDRYPIDVSWLAGVDDVAGGDLHYNLYRRTGDATATLSLIAGLVQGPELRGFQICSGIPTIVRMDAGTYVARAVDWAGNEDSNTVERKLGDACSGLTGSTGPTPGQQPLHGDGGCSVTGRPGGGGTGVWWLVALGAAAALKLRKLAARSIDPRDHGGKRERRDGSWVRRPSRRLVNEYEGALLVGHDDVG